MGADAISKPASNDSLPAWLGAWSVTRRRRVTAFAFFLLVLLACFGGVLIDLCRLALPSPLYSYIPLVPAVTVYLLIQRRRQLAISPPAWGLAAGGAILGFALIAVGQRMPAGTAAPDRLAALVAAWIALLLGGVGACFGMALLRTGLCPWLILLFAIPLPDGLRRGIETILQQASADAAYGLLSLTPVPMYREGMVLHLPRLDLSVAPECSGINSTWVLFICSLVAGTLLLRSPWRRAVLAAVVFPLGVLRNAVRILTIGLLTVYVDPAIIDSPLHHRGGPIFFAASLVVLLAILLALWRSERVVTGTTRTRRRSNESEARP